MKKSLIKRFKVSHMAYFSSYSTFNRVVWLRTTTHKCFTRVLPGCASRTGTVLRLCLKNWNCAGFLNSLQLCYMDLYPQCYWNWVGFLSILQLYCKDLYPHCNWNWVCFLNIIQLCCMDLYPHCYWNWVGFLNILQLCCMDLYPHCNWNWV